MANKITEGEVNHRYQGMHNNGIPEQRMHAKKVCPASISPFHFLVCPVLLVCVLGCGGTQKLVQDLARTVEIGETLCSGCGHRRRRIILLGIGYNW